MRSLRWIRRGGWALLLCLAFSQVSRAQYSNMPLPQTWQPYGGFPQNHGQFNNNLSLVISNTQEAHEETARLLEQLRRLQDMQVAVSTRFNTINDSFFERIGVNFGFNLRGSNGIRGLNPLGQVTNDIQFRQGSFDSARPQFGGYDPNADATIGFGRSGRAGDALFNFAFGQGSTRTNTVQEPTVVLFNGQTGSVSDTTQRPFVTGIIPVVSQFTPPMMMAPAPSVSPLQMSIAQLKSQQQQAAQHARDGQMLPPRPRDEEPVAARARPAPAAKAENDLPQEDAPLVLGRSKDSSAARGDVSVAEIKRQREASGAEAAKPSDTDLRSLIERGRGAEQAGKNSVARIYYQQAANRAEGDLRQKLLARIDALK